MFNPAILVGSLLNIATGGSVDWKNLIKTAGQDVANRQAREQLHNYLFNPHKSDNKSEMQRITEKMQAEGWTWEATSGKVASTPDEGLGRGFVISRDALYRIIHRFVTHGGPIIDAWRDSDDNKIWSMIQADCPQGCPLQTIVEKTADAWINITF